MSERMATINYTHSNTALWEMHAEIWLEIPKERNYTEGIGVDAMTILKLILRNRTGTAWTRL